MLRANILPKNSQITIEFLHFVWGLWNVLFPYPLAQKTTATDSVTTPEIPTSIDIQIQLHNIRTSMIPFVRGESASIRMCSGNTKRSKNSVNPPQT